MGEENRDEIFQTEWRFKNNNTSGKRMSGGVQSALIYLQLFVTCNFLFAQDVCDGVKMDYIPFFNPNLFL